MNINYWRFTITSLLLFDIYSILIYNRTGNTLNLGIALFAGLSVILYDEIIKLDKHFIKVFLENIINKISSKQ